MENTVKSNKTKLRHDWQQQEVESLFALPFNDLLYQASTVHREYFNPNEVQTSTLLSIKTGACPEDCKYCPQSAHYHTNVEKEQLMKIDKIVEEATKAKEAGATRFCMGAAWRNVHDRDMPYIKEVVEQVKTLGLETCMTLGMINKGQAESLKESGLDYYNHNVDSSEEIYKEVITTRTYQDRLETLENVRQSGLNVCSGGIIGLGETTVDRAKMLITLANMTAHPQSVPINLLVKVEGTPLFEAKEVDIFDFIRTIAVARIMMPASHVRLSAGREEMSEEAQALCFLAGANSIFYGEKLLTTPNPAENQDKKLFEKLGIVPEEAECKEKINQQAVA